LSQPVQANAYLSPANSRGFDLHYDTHDVFILQVEGIKEWEFRDAGAALPAADEQHRNNANWISSLNLPIMWRQVLEPGDCVYIPRGYAHQAWTQNSHSLHMTIGVRPIIWRSVFHDLVDYIADREPSLRKAVPAALIRGEQTESEVAGILEIFAQYLQSQSHEVLSEASRERLASEWARTPAEEILRAVCPPEWTDDTLLIWESERVNSVDVQQERLSVELQDRTVSMPAACAELVEHLRARSCSVHELTDATDLDVASVRAVAGRLIAEGVITPSENG
jgi:ribosomal protein L16 Arg81 hydroxylase